jgi:transposase-like protein
MKKKAPTANRLRDWAEAIKEGRNSNPPPDRPKLLLEAADEIDRLRAERDEARRSTCQLMAEIAKVIQAKEVDPVKLAHARGWQCFSPKRR